MNLMSLKQLTNIYTILTIMMLKPTTIIRTSKINNFYNDTFNFRNNAILSNPQRSDITHNMIGTKTQTTNSIDETCLHNNQTATVILNPTPSLTDNYLWIPETSDNVVPGLDSMINYTQSKYATLTTLHNNITTITNTVQTENNILEIPNQGNSIVNEQLYYHNNYTDYTFQRNNTIHTYDNRRTFPVQQH